MSRHQQIFAISCLAPFLMLADFSNDVAYIAKECFTMCHYDAFRGSLLVFAKRKHLSDEEMADRLLYIAANPDRFRASREDSPMRDAVGALYFFPNATNALTALAQYILTPETRAGAFAAYGRITRYDDRFFTFTDKAVKSGKIDKDFYLLKICSALRQAQFPAAEWGWNEKSLLRMKRILVNGQSNTHDNMVYFDRYNCDNIQGYSNSIEHVHAQRSISTLLNENRNRIVKSSCYRGEWGNISDDEWYRRATNSCQAEIARVLALPEKERLNMTAILDARIAAIEAAEARAVRRAVWKRRLRLGAFILPISVIVFAAIFARRRMNR